MNANSYIPRSDMGSPANSFASLDMCFSTESLPVASGGPSVRDTDTGLREHKSAYNGAQIAADNGQR
jgi:hypothetical protein